MKGNNLISTVTNILNKKVTEEEAKNFALNNYGILATYIRQEYVNSLRPPKAKGKRIGRFFGSTLKI